MSIRVLIADPDDAIVVSLEFLLARAGFLVSVADADAELAAFIESEAPDVLVLSAEQPHSDGFELCRRIADSKPAPRILMLSSRARDADVARAREMGASDFLAKPFPTRDFLERVTRLASLIEG